jgi:rhodanese-related sulfurtransferase
LKTLLLCTVCLLAGAALLGAADGMQWALVRKRIAKEFPNVPQLATQDLAAWLADEKREKPVLLDVRAAEEFSVSHLAGARRIDPDATASQLPSGIAKDQPLVTYCSVGYRSSALADRLRAAGYTKVQNLAGSIFQWANEDRPLVSDGNPATVVHPYSAIWSGMLKKERRAPLPRK